MIDISWALDFFSLVLIGTRQLQRKDKGMFNKNEKEFVQGSIAELVIAIQNRNRIMAANGILDATNGGNDSPLRELALEELAGQIGAVKAE